MKKIQDQARRVIEQYPLPLEMAQGEIFPTNVVPVLILEDGDGPEDVPMIWGFPHWKTKGVIINTKAETALEKPMWRDCLWQRPIVVPTTGFYEWREEPDCEKKRKYVFRNHPSRLLYLAGLYRRFPREDGTFEDRFSILTTAATDLMCDYHHRMPVVLEEADLDDWFSGNRLVYFLHRGLCPLQVVPVS